MYVEETFCYVMFCFCLRVHLSLDDFCEPVYEMIWKEKWLEFQIAKLVLISDNISMYLVCI